MNQNNKFVCVECKNIFHEDDGIETSGDHEKAGYYMCDNCAGIDNLHTWFGLSYASFLVLPRILMQEMPLPWKNKMAKLLHEYEATYINQPDIDTRVYAIQNKKLSKWPNWILNYRRPNMEEVNKCKRVIDTSILNASATDKNVENEKSCEKS